MTKKSYPSNLAIIPARGGSKRLKNKNKLLLFGKPLVRHTVQAALMSNKITDVLVSSDSDDILDIACLEENIIRHKRDDSLATDTSTALELVNNHKFGNGTSIYTSDGEISRHFTTNVKIGMVGVNVPIPVPMAFHSFGGWKQSLFGDYSMHGTEGVKFFTKLKTVTSRWPNSIRSGPEFVMPTN